MNIEQFRQSLKDKWLSYYAENRGWLSRIGVWVDCDGQRRPSSSFILATLSVLEPQLTYLLPLIVDLSSNPDRIVMALGLNFNPDEVLGAISAKRNFEGTTPTNGKAPRDSNHNSVRMLPGGLGEVNFPTSGSPYSRIDESCRGRDSRE